MNYFTATSDFRQMSFRRLVNRHHIHWLEIQTAKGLDPNHKNAAASSAGNSHSQRNNNNNNHKLHSPRKRAEEAGAQGCSSSQLADGSLPLHRHLSTFPPPRHAVQVLGFLHDRFVQVFMWLKMEGNHENFSPGLG